jgi:hypothetical protein
MLDNKTNTNTFSAVAISVAFAATSSCGAQMNTPSDEYLFAQPISSNGYNKKLVESTGDAIMYYNHASEVFSATKNSERRVGISSIKMQLRHQAIEKSFAKHSNGFPDKKKDYIVQLADMICKLPFYDNVSSYNDDDETIDTVLKLADGTTLSLSQFLDDDIDASVVFSIHRNKTLLIADELPLAEIVQTINSVISKHNDTVA